MSDIVKRLHTYVACDGGDLADVAEAADEIERLRAALRGLDEAYCRAGSPLSKAERHEDRMRLIAARAALGDKTPNARLNGPKRPEQEYANGTD